MASVGNKEIPMEYAFMGEFFSLRRKYYIPENDNEEYWEQLVLEVRVVLAFRHVPLAEHQVLASDYVDVASLDWRHLEDAAALVEGHEATVHHVSNHVSLLSHCRVLQAA